MAELFSATTAMDNPKNIYIYKEQIGGLKLKYQEYTKEKNKNIIYVKNDSMKFQEVNRYFHEIAGRFNKIELDEEKLNGMPLIKGTRIPISLVLACLRDEMTLRDICDEYNLNLEDIEQAVEYVIQILDIPYQEELD